MKIIRQAELAAALGVSRWTVRRLPENDPSFPRPRAITPGVTGWLEVEIDNWLRSRPALTGPRRRTKDGV